jgi:hypothetical protein
MIPFDIEKWKSGWKPVTRDGNTVEELEKDNKGWLSGRVNGEPESWYPSGYYFAYSSDSPFDLFLLPPDEDIVVEVTELVYGSQRVSLVGKEGEVPPGMYKIVKIDK